MVTNDEVVGVVSLRDLMRVAQIGPTEVPRGLKGVVVSDTEVGDVRGSEGFYHYRQYSAPELARNRRRHLQQSDVFERLTMGERRQRFRHGARAVETRVAIALQAARDHGFEARRDLRPQLA